MALRYNQFKYIKNVMKQFDKNNSYKMYLPLLTFYESDIYKLTDLYTKSLLFYQNPHLINAIDLKQKIVKIDITANIPQTDKIILDYEYLDQNTVLDDIMAHKPVYIDLKTNEYEQFGFIKNNSDIIFLG